MKEKEKNIVQMNNVFNNSSRPIVRNERRYGKHLSDRTRIDYTFTLGRLLGFAQLFLFE